MNSDMNNEISVINKINKKISELTVDDIAKYCADEGLTVPRLCKKLNILLDAKRIRYDRDGDVAGEDEDNNTQLKAVTTGLELLKLIGGKVVATMGVVEHQMAPGDIDRLELIATELKGLESRLVVDKIQQGVLIDTETVN